MEKDAQPENDSPSGSPGDEVVKTPDPSEASSQVPPLSSGADPKKSPGRWFYQKLKLTAPWIVAAGVLIYVFSKVPVSEVARQLVVGEVFWLVPLSAIGVFGLLLLDSFALWRIVTLFLKPCAYGEILAARGSSYLLAALNYNAGQGGLVFLLAKKGISSPWNVTGVVVMSMGLQLVILSLAAGVGTFWGSSSLAGDVFPYAAVGVVGFLIYLALVQASPRILKGRPFFDPLLEAGVSAHMKGLLLKAPHLITLFFYHWLAMKLFGIHLPLGEGFVRLSILFFVVALPISVQGLGTGQAAAVALFSRYSSQGAPAVVAYSLSLWTLSVLCQVTLGVLFLKKGVKPATAPLAASEKKAP